MTRRSTEVGKSTGGQLFLMTPVRQTVSHLLSLFLRHTASASTETLCVFVRVFLSLFFYRRNTVSLKAEHYTWSWTGLPSGDGGAHVAKRGNV